jgi:hypothetical protein
MLKQRRAAAEQVAERLFAAESAIDAALASTAALAGILPTVRGNAGLSVHFAQGAMERASEAVAALTVARGKVVATHDELSITRDQMGLRQVAFGGGIDKPPLPTVHSHLEEVRAA